MNVPELVILEAQKQIAITGGSLTYLGENEGMGYYALVFPEDEDNGFPCVYIYNLSNETIIKTTGFQALDIINSFSDESEDYI